MPKVAATLAGVCILFAFVSDAHGQRTFGPDDPFASIDGAPIYLGELNLILSERMKARDLDAVGIEIKQATAALLVRRHLAMKSLREQGGATLQAMVDRQIESFAHEAKRQGSSLAQQAKKRLADETALKADIAWRTAWSQYLKTTLNDVNLQRYFEREKARYAGGRWRVSQIFVEMDPQDDESVAIATEKMSELAAELRSADAVETAFADAAREYSDAGSAGEGGNVGWVERDGDMPAAVMKAVRKTKVGTVGQPVKSPLGMHLVFVHEFAPGKLTFGDLTDQGPLRRDAANALFDRLVRRQADVKIVWFISALRPPANIKIIPDGP